MKPIKYLYSVCVSCILISFFILGCTKAKSTCHLPESNVNSSLERLIQGNERFMTERPVHPDQTLSRIKELQKGQHPFAIVVSCSDSRVPPELIFDQGLGDIFVIRTAGNVIGDFELGSIEYAVEHLNAHLVVVLGHENCGAIGAFIEHKNDISDDHIQSIINYIKSEEEEANLDENQTNYFDAAVRANVIHGVNYLKQSEPYLKELINKKEILIVGAMYHLEDGKIEMLKENIVDSSISLAQNFTGFNLR
jgi:carbonic anhydrase